MAARIADILMRITHLEGLLMMLVNNVPVSLHIVVTVICLSLCLQILVVICIHVWCLSGVSLLSGFVL